MLPFRIGSKENLGDRYIHACSLKELRGLVRQAGFKIDKSGYTLDKNQKKRNIYIVASKR
jgi:hypothetical protein